MTLFVSSSHIDRHERKSIRLSSLSNSLHSLARPQWTLCPMNSKNASQKRSIASVSFDNSTPTFIGAALPITKLQFFIGTVNGQWKYGFKKAGNVKRVMTLNQVKNLKFPRVCRITVIETTKDQGNLKAVNEMDNLLKFVASVAKRPILLVKWTSENDSRILNWLATMCFAEIHFGLYKPIYDPLLEELLLQTELPAVSVTEIEGNKREQKEFELEGHRLWTDVFAKYKAKLNSVEMTEHLLRLFNFDLSSEQEENFGENVNQSKVALKEFGAELKQRWIRLLLLRTL